MVFLASLIAPPDIPVIDPETNYYTGITKLRLENPVGRIARNNSKYKSLYFVGNFSANLNLTKDLVLPLVSESRLLILIAMALHQCIMRRRIIRY